MKCLIGFFLCVCTVPEDEDNTREAQDTPVISVESNRNETNAQEPAKPRKVAKVPKSSKIADGATTPSALTNDDVTTEASPSGELPVFPLTFFLPLPD